MSGAPGGSTTPPAGTCVRCTTGNLWVTIYKYAVCWDTGPEGIDSMDPPFEGVEVSIGGAHPPVLTGPDGKAVFNGISPGNYNITARKEAYRDVTSTVTPSAVLTATVSVGSTTVAEPRILKRDDLECMRRHVALPGGSPGGPSIWLPLFWVGGDWGEPWILVIRDILWTLALAFTIVGFATLDLGMAGLMFAFFAYLTNVIWGESVGPPMIVLAGMVLIVAIAFALASSVASALGLPAPSPVWTPWLCGAWTGFLYTTILGRTDEFSKDYKLPSIAGGGFGFLVALVLFILMGGFFEPSSTEKWVGMIFVWLLYLVMAFVWAAVAGLFGHAFRNDGQTLCRNWLTGFLLPYEGERYCVQGHRGMISHFGWQEYSYDWSLPEGTPLLCAKEGHITYYREDKDGTQFLHGNDTANEIHVRHKDKSVAEYLHLKKGGVTEFNPDLGPVQANLRSDPVHVHPGQILCGCGNVGISMFPHLHFCVKCPPGGPSDPGPASSYNGVKFQDADVGRHDQRCFSMRKYRSSNVNRGSVVVPPSPAPFRPGAAGAGAAPAPPAGGPPAAPPAPPSPPTPPPPTPPGPPTGPPSPPGI